MLVPQLLPLALAFYRDPRSHPELRDATVPLPAGVTELLESYTGALASEHVDDVAKQLTSSADELHEALRFFVKEVLFRAGDDPMRTLGLQAPLNAELLKKHYRLLITLFHPDRDTSGEGWDTLYASRINDAHGLLRKQLREGNSQSDEWLVVDDALGPVSGGATGQALEGIDTEIDTATDVHSATAGRQPAKPSFDLVHERPSRLLIIWRLLKRRPRLSIYGTLAGLVMAVALFVMVISEPARPVIMATPQPLAKNGTAVYRDMRASQDTPLRTDAAADSADDWRRATLSEPPAAGGDQPVVSQGGTADAGVQNREAIGFTNPYRADADEIERRVEARIRARMESATRSILGRATRPKPTVAKTKPTVAQAKPVEAPAKSDLAQASPTIAQAKPVLAPVEPVTAQPNPAPAPETTTQRPQLAGAEDTASKPIAVIVVEEPADTAAANPELQLQALIVKLENAYELEDVDAFAALFTTNAYATEVEGREAIYAHYADYFANTWIDRFKLVEMAWTPGANGSYAIDSQVEIWMRLKDGSYEEKFVIPIAWLAVPAAEGGYVFDSMEY